MIRSLSPRFLLLPFFLLAACADEGTTETCELPAAAATSDTLLGFQVDGRPVLVSDPGAYAFVDTVTHLFLFSGYRQTAAGWEEMRFQANDLTGGPTGYRLVPYAWVSGTAFAMYSCHETFTVEQLEDPTAYFFPRTEGPADSLLITAYDPATGVIEGSFAFTAWETYGGPTRTFSNGHFRLTATRGALDASTTPAWVRAFSTRIP